MLSLGHYIKALNQGLGLRFPFIIWPVRPRAQFPWETIREKVPYEGRTPGSDRAGKTSTALQEMRTALLETPTKKIDAIVCQK